MIIDACPQHDADADQRDGEESPLRRIEIRHDADQRVVRLANRLLNGADRSCADGASGGDLAPFDRPRLLQRALQRHDPGAHQCCIDLRIGIRLIHGF